MEGIAAVLAAIVLAITQAVKKLIKIEGAGAVILAVIVSILVVVWHYVMKEIPFELLDFLMLLIAVIGASIGGKGLINAAVKKLQSNISIRK